MVEDLHFGGGIFEKKEGGEEAPKTRKEIMAEIIAKSKLHRVEKQKKREEQVYMHA